MGIVRVSGEELVDKWLELEPYILSVIDGLQTGHTAECVLTSVQMGNMQMWRAENDEAAIITQVLTYPRYKSLFIYTTGGENLAEWATDAHNTLKSFACSQGCRYMEFVGRPGWERIAKAHGYNEKYIRMRQEIR